MLRRLSSSIRRLRWGSSQNVPIYLFCHHKVGTILFSKVFSKVCHAFGWRLKHVAGYANDLSPQSDVALLIHSQGDFATLPSAFAGVHLRRDPRDVIVSGYLYHMRTDERWCRNTDFSHTPPILFPRVPYSQQYRSERWKTTYLDSLKGKSYQQNLLDRSQEDGLLFEMQNYGGWTVNDMAAWDYGAASILEVTFEDLMGEYDATFARIFSHCGFTAAQTQQALALAATEDLSRKSDREIAADSHITTRNTSRWSQYFSPTLKAAFGSQFGNVLIDLGYERTHDW